MALSVNLSKVGNGNVEMNVPALKGFMCKTSRNFLPPPCCTPVQRQDLSSGKTIGSAKAVDGLYYFDGTNVESGILCEPCSGRGWLICDFCKGQRTNVKSENNRIYRRCPSCRAVGYILCSKCKVFKCVTFPDNNDGVDLTL